MAYELNGESLGRAFRQEQLPTLTTNSSEGLRMAVSELRRDQPGFGFSAPLPAESAYLVGLQLRAIDRHELWLDGRSVPVNPIAGGAMHIFDLQRNPVCYTNEPFHDLFFYIPRAALAELREDFGGREVVELGCRDGQFLCDPVIHGLGLALLHTMRTGPAHEQVFVDHVMLALRSHLLTAYPGTSLKPTAAVHGLARWQEQAVKELMSAYLGEGISLKALADVCDISTSTLVRGFKRSTGYTPHQWLIRRRLDLAMQLMRRRELSLADIATQVGFADQSHFTRAFSRIVGCSPATWRLSQG
ncbi:helix-turn-helix transcriptional regulator [Pseudomonas sp. QE6]|uniref:helix-turn-helix transcriptional regulator n=1 Tax=Pseudomonas sp. QE6 TaxID=3242491 RepID=UPI0035270FE7